MTPPALRHSVVGWPKKLYYVYLLRSYSDGKFYIGLTTDIQRRLMEHNEGLSRYTNGRGPFKLLYFEGFIHPEEAKAREVQLKRQPNVTRYLKQRLFVTTALASSDDGGLVG